MGRAGWWKGGPPMVPPLRRGDGMFPPLWRRGRARVGATRHSPLATVPEAAGMIRLRRLRLSQYKGLEQVDLAFPPQGSVLIEGLNEAGKSTLFDGLHFVLYGRPLVGDLAEVFTYGAQRTIAYAELDVDVDRTLLIVERRLTSRTGSPGHQVQLSVQKAESGDVESVRGVRAVRERLIAELGGLTAEALQNSCLVVQKALGRLETLTRREREGALSVLLNLGRLSEIESTLRPSREYEDEVRRAEGIAGMAAVAAERITLRAQLEEQQRLAALARLRDDLAALDTAADRAKARRRRPRRRRPRPGRRHRPPRGH